jgi:glycosyltransferase involved in cell wall biosynthesis
VIGPKARRAKYDVAFYMPWIGPLLAAQPGLTAGGAETQVFLLARELVRRGLRVCLLAFDVPGATVPRSIEGIDVRVRPPYTGGQPLLEKLREVARIGGALADADADAVVTRALGPHVGLVAIFARLRKKRFVYASASPMDFEFERCTPKARNRLLFRIGIRLADAVVVQTEEQAELCRRRFRRTPRLVRSVAEVVAPTGREPEAFLWIGRIVGWKRPLEFVELARSVPEATFKLVAAPAFFEPGAPELFAALERAVRDVPNLELLPPHSRAELMELVDGAVAVVSTSEFEGMPNVFLEAWARGVPTIAFEHDPDGIVERERLGGVAAGSRKTLVDVARELWSSRGDRGALSERCRRYVAEHHSARVVAAEWESILRKEETAPLRSARPSPREAAYNAAATPRNLRRRG